jgi:hypothetical protein
MTAGQPGAALNAETRMPDDVPLPSVRQLGREIISTAKPDRTR